MSIFEKSADSHTPKPPEVGSLTQGDDTFIYSSPGNEFLTFDNTGKLLSIRKNGISQHLKYTEDFVEVLDDFGFSLKFTEDARRQPLSLATEHVNILYEYNTYIQLKSVIRNYPDRSERRKYFYEDPMTAGFSRPLRTSVASVMPPGLTTTKAEPYPANTPMAPKDHRRL
ncbi:hypothetical protein QNM99_00615 [Pseudomonas sp. PCH446]